MDLFVDAMKSIAQEVEEIADGVDRPYHGAFHATG